VDPGSEAPSGGSSWMQLRKGHVIAILFLAQAWPVYLAIRAAREGPAFRELFAKMGISVPWISEFFLATCRYWLVVPVVTIALVSLCLHPRVKTLKIPLVVFFATILLSYAMEYVMIHGIFEPLIELIRVLSRQAG